MYLYRISFLHKSNSILNRHFMRDLILKVVILKFGGLCFLWRSMYYVIVQYSTSLSTTSLTVNKKWSSKSLTVNLFNIFNGSKTPLFLSTKSVFRYEMRNGKFEIMGWTVLFDMEWFWAVISSVTRCQPYSCFARQPSWRYYTKEILSMLLRTPAGEG